MTYRCMSVLLVKIKKEKRVSFHSSQDNRTLSFAHLYIFIGGVIKAIFKSGVDISRPQIRTHRGKNLHPDNNRLKEDIKIH